MTLANKHKSNQHKPDPRQELCWEIYTNPGTENFSNAYRSAILAGYSMSTARVIKNRTWLYEKVRRMNLLALSDTHIDKVLASSHIVPIMGKNGPIRDIFTGATLYKIDSEILKHKVEVAMFIYKKFSKYLT